MGYRSEAALGLLWVAGAMVTGCFSDPISGMGTAAGGTSGGVGESTAAVDAPSTGMDGDETTIGSDSTGDFVTGSTSGSDDGSGTMDTDAEAASGEVRLVHASPDAGAVDVYLTGEDTPIVEDLRYLDTTSWVAIESGRRAFEVRPAGADAESPPVLAQSVDVDEMSRTSVLAVGLAGGEKTDALRLLPVVESWGNALAGRARIQFVHAAPDGPAVVLEGLDGPPASLERFEATGGPGIPLNSAGGQRLMLLDGKDELTTFTAPPVAEGEELLVVATGRLGALAREPDGLSLLAVGEGGALPLIRQDPQLFTLHGARDAATLETCTGNIELAGNFEYGEVQSTRVSPGAYPLGIYDYPSGCIGEPLNVGGNTTGPLEAGERYLLLVTGERVPEGEAPLVEPGIQVATFRDRFALDDDERANVRFVHGASAQQIYVGSLTGAEIVGSNIYTTPIGWRAESDETSLMQGFYFLGIADAVGKPSPPLSPLVDFSFDAVGGARQWGIVSGDPSPEDGDGFVQLMLVDTTTPDWATTLVDVNPT